MSKVLDRCVKTPALCIPYILMSSYLYYIQHVDTPLTDYEFDQLCRLALDNWDDIRHPHKRLIQRADLEAGTLYAVKRYPLIVMGAANHWRNQGERS